MHLSKFPLVQRAALMFVLGLCCATFPLIAQDGRLPEDCKSVTSWMVKNAGNLPKSYEELGELPVAYRRAIFSTLSGEEKSDLWRNHLQRQLEAGEHALNSEQRKLIERAIELTGDELFDGRRERVARLRIAAFEKAVRGHFNNTETRRIFGQIGPEAAVSYIIVKPTACACSSVSDYCPDGYGCDEKSACEEIDDACGFMWSHDCDGLCVDPSNAT